MTAAVGVQDGPGVGSLHLPSDQSADRSARTADPPAGTQFGINPAEYRIIAPSRHGYLRTPMPAGPDGETTPAAEADAHACLLDALGIREPAVVLGGSVGALSATQLAIEYPERVSKLVLTVPANWAPATPDDASLQDVGGSGFIHNVVLRSDFLVWAFMRLAGDEMASFIGVSKELQRDLSAEDRESVVVKPPGLSSPGMRWRKGHTWTRMTRRPAARDWRRTPRYRSCSPSC